MKIFVELIVKKRKNEKRSFVFLEKSEEKLI
jgi:hypothetical protein